MLSLVLPIPPVHERHEASLTEKGTKAMQLEASAHEPALGHRKLPSDRFGAYERCEL